MEDMISEELGEEYVVRLESVRKNNNIHMLGIMVTKKNQNISPTIYLEKFYQDYLEGEETEELAWEIAEALRRGTPKGDFDLNFFRDYQVVKDNCAGDYSEMSDDPMENLLKFRKA